MYEHTRNGIIKAGFDPTVIEAIGQVMASTPTSKDADAHYHSFELEADKLPWPQDHDFGALVLQAASGKVSDTGVREFLLAKALERAQWCATCATSGGEGLARMQHVQALKAELSALKP